MRVQTSTTTVDDVGSLRRQPDVEITADTMHILRLVKALNDSLRPGFEDEHVFIDGVYFRIVHAKEA